MVAITQNVVVSIFGILSRIPPWRSGQPVPQVHGLCFLARIEFITPIYRRLYVLTTAYTATRSRAQHGEDQRNAPHFLALIETTSGGSTIPMVRGNFLPQEVSPSLPMRKKSGGLRPLI